MTRAAVERALGAPLRPHAKTRQVWWNWGKDGVPWEIAGPLFLSALQLERSSHASRSASTRTRDSVQGADGEMAHVFTEAQKELWRIYEAFGPESNEWAIVAQALHQVDELAKRVTKPVKPVSRRPTR